MKNRRLVNILFLGGAKRISLGERFIKAGKELNISINIFSYELNKAAPLSSIAKEIIIGLRWDDNEIKTHLLNTIKEYDIDIVVPLVDPAISISAKIKGKSKKLFVPVPDMAVCELFFDKLKANQWFIKNGFNVPEKNGSSLIAKMRRGSASKGIFIIKTNADRRFFLNRFDREQYIMQRFIEGDEYSIDCYVSTKGKIMAVVPRRRIEIINGEVTRSVTTKDGEIIGLAKKIIKRCNFQGPLIIQVIREKGIGKLFVLEINPRFGSGVITSIEAGANFPLFLLKDYLDIPNKPVNSWKENLLMVRAYREVFFNAYNY